MANDSSGSLAALILAGGSGTRLWPRSTDQVPKPFLSLGGERSLLAETFERAADLAGPERVFFSARASHAGRLQQEFPACLPSQMLLEPERRNTAPAIALSALAIEELTPEATLIVLPSDQGVADSVAFGAALRQAVDAARREEVFVTLGIPPVRPETGYGYLETADGDRASVRRVIRFVEKPAFAKAKEYLASGRFFWNAGIFVFQIRVLLNAMQEFAPEILAAVREAHEARRRGDDAAFRAAFGRSPKLSIDYAVMEKAREVRTVPASCGWSDLGSWESVHDFRPKDQNGNVSEGNATLIGTTNSLVLSCGKKVTVIGLDGVVVVDSPDGLLVSRKGRSDELRDFVEAELARRAKA